MRFIISNFVIDVKEKRKSQSGGGWDFKEVSFIEGENNWIEGGRKLSQLSCKVQSTYLNANAVPNLIKSQ